MKTKFFYLACALMIQLAAKAQMKIGDNSTSINNASLLELETTNKGLVLPRVSITNVSAASPLPSGLLTGTVVYNTNATITGGSGVGIYLWDGTKWLSLSTGSSLGSSAWLLTGNSGLSSSTNFIGTTDAIDFVARTNNIERMRILGAVTGNSQPGWIGMGVTTPRSSLDVTGNYTNKNIITIQNTSASGFSSVDMLDNTGVLKGTFGYGNSGASANFASRLYFNTYGGDFLLTSNSGTSHFLMKGGTGFVGINTSTPSERLHVVGNIYLNGAFMPGGDAGTSGYVLTSAGVNTSPVWKNVSGLSWGLTGNSGLNPTTNFIGTTDNVSMRFRTNNVQRMIIDSIGRVGIGTNTPSERLDVSGNLRFSGALMPNNSAGSAGFFLVSSGANNPPTWFDASNYAWQLDGNPVTALKKFGTTTNFDIPFITNNAERMRLTANGFLGIGTTNPAYKLSVLGTDPLYLSGVQATSTFSTDSVLTISGGVVKKAPYSSLSGNFWSTTGNSGIDSATNFIGTKDNTSLRFRTNNMERMSIDTSGIVSIGDGGVPSFNPSNPPILSVDYGTTTSNTVAYLRGSVDSYLQMNIRNKSTGLFASSDYVATADNGTDSTFYIDMGINNSGYGTGADYFGGPNDAYLYAYSKNLLIGTQKASTDIIFLLNGGSVKNNSAMRIASPGGNIVIGKGEASNTPVGNVIRGPNANTGSTNIAGGSLTLQGGSATGTATGGNLNLYGGTTVSGTIGAVNINSSSNSATNINTGTSASTVTIGNALNNVNLPKLSATSVVLTDAGKNLTSTTPSNNTYLYYDGTNFTWSTAATLGSFSAIAPLTYNNTTGVFAINKATNLTDGYLSSTDWNTFNNKVGSITLNTPSSVFSNPINFSVSSGAATGTLSLNTQTANTVFAGPIGGTAAAPTFRTLVAADIPSLAGSYIQNQTTQQASSNFNISGSGTIGTNLSVTGASTLTGAVTTKAGITNTGTVTTSGGDVSINVSTNNSTNINSGTSTSNVTIGNSGNNILLPKFNTAGGMIYTSVATGQIASTGANMKWDDVNNRLGIGITNPSYKLSVLSANDPLYLSGVQATNSFTTDSILTILNGVVKKTPYSSLPGSTNTSWSLTGNSGTVAGTNFVGTTDAQPLVLKSLNRQLAYFDGNLYSIALGFGAVNGSSDHNVAIGYNATTNNQYTLALGYNATATGVRSVAIGNGGVATIASGAESVAMGYNATASAAQTVAIGYQALSSNSYGVAIGYGAQATGSQGTAIGYSALASAQYTNAIGFQAQATGLQSTAIGYKAQTAQGNTILLGDVNTPNLYVGIGTASPTAKLEILAQPGTGVNPLEITGLPPGTSGTDNFLTINASGVVGYVSPASVSGNYWSLSGNAATSGSFLGTTNTTPLQFKFNSTAAGYLDANNTALGTGYTYSGTSNTAIGYSANAANSSTAVGANADASQASNTAIGNNATANVSSQATAIGASAQAPFQYNTALGYNAQALLSSQETVIGASAQAQGQNNIAVGYTAKANGSDRITVVGSAAQASFQNNTAIGYGALATINNQATTVGAASQAGAQNATALGYNAKATGANSTALGYNAQTTTANTLVLGDATNTSLNVGVGTATPGNKVEIRDGVAGNSGLRFTNLTSANTPVANPNTQGGILSVNASGDVILVKDAGSTSVATSSNSAGSNCNFCNGATSTLASATGSLNVNVGDVVVIEANLMIYATSGTNTANNSGGDFVTVKPVTTGTAGVTWGGGATPRSVINYASSGNRGPYTSSFFGANSYPGVSPTSYLEYGTVTTAGTLSASLQGTFTTDDPWTWNNTVLILRKN